MTGSEASFAQHLSGYHWDDIKLSFGAKTAADVERALSRSANQTRLDLNDFMALISPAAEPYLEQMAQRSLQLTQQRFGKTIQLYVPLYLSNLCSNICTYCGFSMHNAIRRKTLDMVELDAEIAAIKQLGFDHILLVTGESERKVGMEYFRQAVPKIRENFSHVSMEVQPLSTQEYQELKDMGVDSILVYQETYSRQTYAEHHLKGKKNDFDWRLATPERLGQVGMNKVGIGALIGLDDWRVDCFMVAAHLQYLEKRFWQTRYSISFPRLRPCTGGLEPKSVMTDRQLVQLICAYRMFNPELELSLSTRESAAFRDHALPLGITSMSAYSRTQPGGYAEAEPALEQFSISDERHPKYVAQAIVERGYQPVWTDWQPAYGRSAIE
ncbi:2-iminoacetate synthase ThiH [Echinimonas agarilytica]|uniref:2-iminoacetate synthase ThiH n=1 Tax=Echinimonas agarilytica TaxID=1215918 RepID=A0AA41W8P7_9GAMM|nr:2-iminoacetate synthase ThiH [Echinimonas agarilytica]MCM2681079.1 2-iminoacetate synthase ThiH [Echinimonas agarilytica]